MISREIGKRVLIATRRGVLGIAICMCTTQYVLSETVLLGVNSSGVFLVDTQSAASSEGLASPSVAVSTQGIRGSGVRGIRGSGVRKDGTTETQGIRGSGLRDETEDAQQQDVSTGVPLLAIGPVTGVGTDSISVMGVEIDLTETTQLLAVETSGEVTSSLAAGNDSSLGLGDYVAVGGFGAVDAKAANVVVVSPVPYLEGSSSVFIRGAVANAKRDIAKLEIDGMNVDYSGALWSVQNAEVKDGVLAEFAGVAHSGVIYATEGEVLDSFPPEAQATDVTAVSQGIRGSGVRGIRGSGVRGIRGSGVRGIRGSGVRGIRGSGVRGIRGSGVRGDDDAEALGIRGSGVRGIRGSGVR
ncbi:MAG: hypothetical protein JSV45_03430 [Chromatiales bacterium]|nr:MAG: hypothetical protein JSV45_03430 [Chromatiales bacterium]